MDSMDNMDELDSIVEIVNRMRDRGHHPSVLESGGDESTIKCSYAGLHESILRSSVALSDFDLSSGDRVVLLAPNSLDWIVRCMSVIFLGAVIVPVDYQTDDETLSHILEDCGARIICTDRKGEERIGRLDMETPPRVLLLDETSERETKATKAKNGENHPRSEKLSDSSPTARGDSVAAIFYTSGTTGLPKGVPLTQRNICHQIRYLGKLNVVDEDDRFLLPLPLHHIYPFSIGMLLPLYLGATLVFPRTLTGPALSSIIQTERITALVGVPRLYSVLVQGIENQLQALSWPVAPLTDKLWNLCASLKTEHSLDAGKILLKPIREKVGKSLRLLASGGSALEPDVLRRLEGMGWDVLIGYGLTETAPLLTVNLSGASRPDSAGKPIDGVELRIDYEAEQEQVKYQAEVESGSESDESGSSPESSPESSNDSSPESSNDSSGVSTDEFADSSDRSEYRYGEVLARGPNIFGGYLNLPDKSAEVLTADGWFRTGDRGRLDDDGFLYLKGRLSTMLVPESGENIQAEELEKVYEQSAGVEEVGILVRKGKLVAVIVQQSGRSSRSQETSLEKNIRAEINRIAKELPSYKRLSRVLVTSKPIPRTRLGKIRRKKLEKMFDEIESGADEGQAERKPMAIGEMTSEDQALMQNSGARKVWDLLCRKFENERLTPDSNLGLDLGVDSLEWVNLTLDLRTTAGVVLDENSIQEISTVRELIEQCRGGSDTASPQSIQEIFDEPESRLSADDRLWIRRLRGPSIAIFWLLYWFNHLLFKVFFRLSVKGLDNLEKDGPLIIAPNHSSFLDPFALAAAYPYKYMRQTFWAGNERVAFGNALTRRASRLAQGLPINPFDDIMKSLALSAAVLKRRERLVWFPEGERSHSGKLIEFKPGIGFLAARLDVPILPVHIAGAYDALPVGRFFPKPVRLTVRFGDPLEPDRLEQRGEGREREKKIASGLRLEMEDLMKFDSRS